MAKVLPQRYDWGAAHQWSWLTSTPGGRPGPGKHMKAWWVRFLDAARKEHKQSQRPDNGRVERERRQAATTGLHKVRIQLETRLGSWTTLYLTIKYHCGMSKRSYAILNKLKRAFHERRTYFCLHKPKWLGDADKTTQRLIWPNGYFTVLETRSRAAVPHSSHSKSTVYAGKHSRTICTVIRAWYTVCVLNITFYFLRWIVHWVSVEPAILNSMCFQRMSSKCRNVNVKVSPCVLAQS